VDDLFSFLIVFKHNNYTNMTESHIYYNNWY
jgi:hypothetical protein